MRGLSSLRSVGMVAGSACSRLKENVSNCKAEDDSRSPQRTFNITRSRKKKGGGIFMKGDNKLRYNCQPVHAIETQRISQAWPQSGRLPREAGPRLGRLCIIKEEAYAKHRLEMGLGVGRWPTLRFHFWKLTVLRTRQTEREIIGVKRMHQAGIGPGRININWVDQERLSTVSLQCWGGKSVPHENNSDIQDR